MMDSSKTFKYAMSPYSISNTSHDYNGQGMDFRPGLTDLENQLNVLASSLGGPASPVRPLRIRFSWRWTILTNTLSVIGHD